MQRILFGWIPFSIGDLLYGYVIVSLIIQLIKLIRRIRTKTASFLYLKGVATRLIAAVLIVYITFNGLWGLNYNRRGIDYQLKLNSLEYDKEDLIEVTEQLAERMNTLQPSSEITRNSLKKKKNLFHSAIGSYKNLSEKINCSGILILQ